MAHRGRIGTLSDKHKSEIIAEHVREGAQNGLAHLPIRKAGEKFLGQVKSGRSGESMALELRTHDPATLNALNASIDLYFSVDRARDLKSAIISASLRN